MAVGWGTAVESDSRKSVLAIAVVALWWLGACGGRAALGAAEDGGASSAAPEAASNAGGVSVNGDGTSASDGAATGTSMAGASTKPACCLSIPSCNYGDETLSDTEACPPAASCYSLSVCCGGEVRCAHVAPPPIDAGPPADAGACNLLGTWATHSALWNGKSTDNEITFKSDGILVGNTYFVGSWSLVGSTLTIENTSGLDMDCAFADHWTLTFSADCQTAPLLMIDSGCSGARRYLDGNVTLTFLELR